MTLWRVYRLERTPNADSNPGSHTYQMTARDDTSGAMQVINFGINQALEFNQQEFLNEVHGQLLSAGLQPDDTGVT